MSSAPHVERFKGTKWEECHDFIAAIRTRAFWEGKQRDSAWKADFAATLFWGKALSWHSQLPEDVREDWAKLEVALLERWPPAEDDEEPQINPTPAAAPSLDHNEKPNRPLQGVLKLVLDGYSSKYYIKRPAPNGRCYITNDTNDALRVRCDSLAGDTLLEQIDHPCHSWLATQWASFNSNIGNGSTNYARLTFFDLDTLKSAWCENTPFQLLRCTVLANGQVIPAWKQNSGNQITLTPFVEDTECFCLAADPEAYARKYPNETRAKFFIEPIN